MPVQFTGKSNLLLFMQAGDLGASFDTSGHHGAMIPLPAAIRVPNLATIGLQSTAVFKERSGK